MQTVSFQLYSARNFQPFADVFRILADAGYKGYISLEYEDESDPFKAVPEHLKTIRALAKKYSTES